MWSGGPTSTRFQALEQFAALLDALVQLHGAPDCCTGNLTLNALRYSIRGKPDTRTVGLRPGPASRWETWLGKPDPSPPRSPRARGSCPARGVRPPDIPHPTDENPAGPGTCPTWLPSTIHTCSDTVRVAAATRRPPTCSGWVCSAGSSSAASCPNDCPTSTVGWRRHCWGGRRSDRRRADPAATRGLRSLLQGAQGVWARSRSRWPSC